MRQGYFITGTDTDAGKTRATLALMQFFKHQGKTVVGMKPVASGCEYRNGKLQNGDALLLQAHASVPAAYELINPYAYERAVSPHLAGRDNPADLAVLKTRFEQLKSLADIVLVEGAGGWHAPINEREDVSDLALAFGLPVILAAAIRLGCISHAKLTAQAIALKGLRMAGWIAVCNDSRMTCTEDNITTIQNALNAPLLGVIPFQQSADLADLHRFIRPDAL